METRRKILRDDIHDERAGGFGGSARGIGWRSQPFAGILQDCQWFRLSENGECFVSGAEVEDAAFSEVPDAT